MKKFADIVPMLSSAVRMEIRSPLTQGRGLKQEIGQEDIKVGGLSMSISRGKEFEKILIKSFESIPDADVRRLKDQQSFFKGSSNDCDILVYHWPTLFIFEAKSFHGDRFPLSNISYDQFTGLSKSSKKHGTRCGVILWAIDHKKVYFISIQTIKLILKQDIKSIAVSHLEVNQSHDIVEFKSETKRIYPEFTNPLQFLRDIQWKRG